MIEIWAEKYRPKTMDEYVWRDPQMRLKVEEWLAEGGLPHLLLSGVSGTGKTSLLLLLMKLLEIPHEDLMKINASRERGIEALQDKIIGFINAWTLNKTGLKYILLDEADRLSPLAQGMLRNEMETYANTCRFLMTCNYPNKIIPALHGRMQEIKFSKLDESDFINRAADVLFAEKVTFEPEILVGYYNKTYPDLRKCIGLIQQNTIDHTLTPIREDEGAVQDYLIQAIDLFRDGKFLEGRKLIIGQADADEYNSIYRFFYENLDMFGETEGQQNDALLIIRKAIVYDGTVADREINLAAAMCELTSIKG